MAPNRIVIEANVTERLKAEDPKPAFLASLITFDTEPNLVKPFANWLWSMKMSEMTVTTTPRSDRIISTVKRRIAARCQNTTSTPITRMIPVAIEELARLRRDIGRRMRPARVARGDGQRLEERRQREQRYEVDDESRREDLENGERRVHQETQERVNGSADRQVVAARSRHRPREVAVHVQVRNGDQAGQKEGQSDADAREQAANLGDVDEP